MSRKAMLGWLLMAVLLIAVPVSARENLIGNGSSEIQEPFFWRAGSAGGDLVWADDAAHNGTRSLKIIKSSTGEEATWVSFDQANTYWNGMDATTYTFSFWAKTDGVNTAPAGESKKIGMRWVIDGTAGSIMAVDQTNATSDWAEYTFDMTLTAAPGEAYIEFVMGSDATGTVWVDHLGLSSDPWTAGIFGDDFDTAAGWMHWASTDLVGFAEPVMMADAPDGDYVVKLEETDSNDDEMVYYSVPTQAEPSTMYMVGVWVKQENVNTGDMFFPTDAIGQHIGDRGNLCFFFHRGDLYNGWDITGGDQFIYFDQREATPDGWVKYSALVKSPEDATGISMRARFNNTNTGTVYYDNFFVYEVTPGANIVENGDLETVEPFFWNEGSTGGTMTWDDSEASDYERSLKIEKAATGSAASWISDNQASTYWNGMDATTYSFSFYAKTSGVNTAPAGDSEMIGARWVIDGTAGPIIPVDQSSAAVDWTEYSGEITLTAAPTTAKLELMMGSDATGTVWFDQFSLSSDPWTAGIFGADADTPVGWMHWASTGDVGYAQQVDVGGDAYSGSHVVKLLEEDGNADEMVYYSVPYAVNPNSYYEFSVYVKQVGMAPLSDSYLPSQVMGDNIAEWANLCFFFHRGDIVDGWDITGGDKFLYFQQVEADSGWTEYRGVMKSPEDATGASLRARFNSLVTGEVWFDDFSIRELTVEDVTLDVGEEPGDLVQLPSGVELEQNYPNPFNPETTISFVLPQAGQVQLTVYDMLGREVARLVDGVRNQGRHEVSFSAGELASGVYFYALQAGDVKVVRKMVLMK